MTTPLSEQAAEYAADAAAAARGICWPHTPGDALTAQQNLYETEMRQEPAPNPAPTQGGV